MEMNELIKFQKEMATVLKKYSQFTVPHITVNTDFLVAAESIKNMQKSFSELNKTAQKFNLVLSETIKNVISNQQLIIENFNNYNLNLSQQLSELSFTRFSQTSSDITNNLDIFQIQLDYPIIVNKPSYIIDCH